MNLKAIVIIGLCLFGIDSQSLLNAQDRQRGRTAWQPTEEDLAKVIPHVNIPYQDNAHERQHLDIFLPRNSKKRLPVVVWIHGGAWHRGDKSNCPPLREGFVDKGFAIASVGYRLSGDATFPAQIEDCRAAIRFLRANSDKYGIDPERIGVWGSSAGGHLAALLATSGDHNVWDVGLHLNQSARVQAVCNFYGPANFLKFANKRGADARRNTPENRLLGGPVADLTELARAASPIFHVSGDDPPFLIYHGDQDRNVDISQSIELRDRLLAASVDCSFHQVSGAGHGSPKFYDPLIMQQVEDFFQKHLAVPTGAQMKNHK